MSYAPSISLDYAIPWTFFSIPRLQVYKKELPNKNHKRGKSQRNNRSDLNVPRVSEPEQTKLRENGCDKPSHVLTISITYHLEHIKVVEEKFGKMKEVYSNLREEHIDLLRKVSFFFLLSGSLIASIIIAWLPLKEP